MKIVVMAPKKHPTLYAATDIPAASLSIYHNFNLPQCSLTLDGRPMILLIGIETEGFFGFI